MRENHCLDRFLDGLRLERSVREHARRFERDHSPALARAAHDEACMRARARVTALEEATRTAYGHEAKAQAARELDDARRARIALLAGELPPISRTEQLREMQRPH